ncbi:MAG: RNA polymerase sigma factor [Planctomycetota bacterium]|jgi:RNA polymerase sigma-70 factor (ECF subfamily)
MSENRHLLKRLHRGDRDALRRIYEKYRTDLFTVAASLLHDVHASEDCLQDVFVSFADAAGSLNIRRNLKGYLISCVANRARDQLRKKPAALNYPEDADCPAAATDPVRQAIGREESVRILEALAELPYEQREAFVLHVQAGMKFRQIARLQDVSIKTAHSRYRYAIGKLQALLEKGNQDEVGK